MKSIFLFILVFTAFSSCKKPVHERQEPESVRVKVVPLHRENISLPVVTSGLVVPAEEIKLSFKTGGLISAIYVSEGMRVSKGDVLAALNLSEIEAQVEQYKGGYDKALRDFNRAKKLYADSVATLEQMQNAETALKVSKAGFDAANFNLQHSRIVAPENGTILKKLAENSEMIAPGYPVLLFGTSNKGWKIRTGLADKDFVRISVGDSALATLDAYPESKFRAIVSRISETANPYTGTFEAELDLKAAGLKLAAGFVANLEIYPGKAEGYISLPVESLTEADGSYGSIFTVNDSMLARKVRVRIFKVYQSSVALYDDQGLKGRVITEGAAYVSDGGQVIIIP